MNRVLCTVLTVLTVLTVPTALTVLCTAGGLSAQAASSSGHFMPAVELASGGRTKSTNFDAFVALGAGVVPGRATSMSLSPETEGFRRDPDHDR